MQTGRSVLRGGAVLSGVLALGLAFAGFSGASAQDGTSMLEEAPRPGHIHAGSCADLGEIVYPLTNATLNGLPEGMLGMTEYQGSPNAFPVEISETEIVDVTLDDLLSGQYAINFHESENNIQNYIACGDIGGVPQDNSLYVGLAELNQSGYAGIAVIEGSDDDEGVEVTVYLSPVIEHAAAPSAAPSLAATPEAPMVTVEVSPSVEASPEVTEAPTETVEATEAVEATETATETVEATETAEETETVTETPETTPTSESEDEEDDGEGA